MARRINMAARAELVRAIVDRYLAGSRLEKQRILDEFVVVTGDSRKHAIRLFRPWAATLPAPRRRLRYGTEEREALVVLWEASDRLCAKRLKPLIPVLRPTLERHGRLLIENGLRQNLLAVSSATIGRVAYQAGSLCADPVWYSRRAGLPFHESRPQKRACSCFTLLAGRFYEVITTNIQRGSIMNKPDLVEKIAADYDFTRVLAREVVDTILQTISETIQSGEEVALAGFGKFKLVERAARVGRNPQTGEPVKIAASKRVKFEQAKAMRELVNIKKRGRKKAK